MQEKERDYTTQIQNMRKSGECHRQIRKYAQRIIRPGIKMEDMCIQIEIFSLCHGYSKLYHRSCPYDESLRRNSKIYAKL